MAAKKQAVDYHRSEPLLCASAGCPHHAIVRVQRSRAEWLDGKLVHTPYGPKLNLCNPCDDLRHQTESREYCLQMGLETVEKQKAWAVKRMKDPLKVLESEPMEEAECPL